MFPMQISAEGLESMAAFIGQGHFEHLRCSIMSQPPIGNPQSVVYDCIKLLPLYLFFVVVLRYYIIYSKWQQEKGMHQVPQE